jgi:hypothetical protein
MRKYTCIVDNGHDSWAFDFYSEHRAKSKLNMEDARKEMQLKYNHIYSIRGIMLSAK